MMLIRLLAGLLLLSLCGATSAYARKPVVSIIIDDMGYQFEQDRQALSLTGPLTYAILPYSPGARYVQQAAKAGGAEIMLHLPMEPALRTHKLSSGTLTHAMDWITFVRTVQKNLAEIPGIVAVNNHQGSGLTADSQRMHWLMEELSRHRGIAFIDSRTTRHTVALDTARKYGLAATRRDVFLDYAPGKIAEQFNELISKAREQGSALAIAHPHAETIAFLRSNLGRLKQMDIDLVPVTRLIAMRQQLRSAKL